MLRPTPGNWVVSWGGATWAEPLNTLSAPIQDLLTGDFDGDRRADVLYTNGYEWLVSWGGTSTFTPYASSTWRAADLRTGDFDGDGRTDVFGIVDGYWQVMFATVRTWTRLQAALAAPIQGLVVADFSGDGIADVAQSYGGNWRHSQGGTTGWLLLLAGAPSGALDRYLAIGRFDDAVGADVIRWSENHFEKASRGVPFARHSRQDMR